jgi:hypothetical protein
VVRQGCKMTLKRFDHNHYVWRFAPLTFVLKTEWGNFRHAKRHAYQFPQIFNTEVIEALRDNLLSRGVGDLDGYVWFPHFGQSGLLSDRRSLDLDTLVVLL